jgi:ankyrin repeat protein
MAGYNVSAEHFNAESTTFTALIYATRFESKTVAGLLESGVNVNELDSHQRSPLICAFAYSPTKEATEIAQLLLDHKADINLTCRDTNPLISSVEDTIGIWVRLPFMTKNGAVPSLFAKRRGENIGVCQSHSSALHCQGARRTLVEIRTSSLYTFQTFDLFLNNIFYKRFLEGIY